MVFFNGFKEKCHIFFLAENLQGRFLDNQSGIGISKTLQRQSVETVRIMYGVRDYDRRL